MNDIFDLFNSNNKYSNTFYPFKNALSEENKEAWTHTFQRCEEYILGLQTLNGDNIVKKSAKKIGFVAIISNISAMRKIYSDIVETGLVDYVCTYKLSQDPLEHFFLWLGLDLGQIIILLHINSNQHIKGYC